MANYSVPTIVTLLQELRKSDSLFGLDELMQLTPPGLFDMMRIKGPGGKKLGILWKVAKIDDVEDLLAAAKAARLAKISGFGIKTEKNIIASFEELCSNMQEFHYADVADVAKSLVIRLKKAFGEEKISLCGNVRRHSTTVPSIEILAAFMK